MYAAVKMEEAQGILERLPASQVGPGVLAAILSGSLEHNAISTVASIATLFGLVFGTVAIHSPSSGLVEIVS
jgi:hypothetical protein